MTINKKFNHFVPFINNDIIKHFYKVFALRYEDISHKKLVFSLKINNKKNSIISDKRLCVNITNEHMLFSMLKFLFILKKDFSLDINIFYEYLQNKNIEKETDFMILGIDLRENINDSRIKLYFKSKPFCFFNPSLFDIKNEFNIKNKKLINQIEMLCIDLSFDGTHEFKYYCNIKDEKYKKDILSKFNFKDKTINTKNKMVAVFYSHGKVNFNVKVHDIYDVTKLGLNEKFNFYTKKYPIDYISISDDGQLNIYF